VKVESACQHVSGPQILVFELCFVTTSFSKEGIAPGCLTRWYWDRQLGRLKRPTAEQGQKHKPDKGTFEPGLSVVPFSQVVHPELSVHSNLRDLVQRRDVCKAERLFVTYPNFSILRWGPF
jgi:hypothetical protein